MTRPSHNLEQLQRWMQTVITHHSGVEAGIESKEALRAIDISVDDVEQVIGRSHALGSLERLRIYGNAYYARLMECLRETFPCLAYALGDDVFSEFAFGYLQHYPSTSYTLGDLGKDFARYLQETRPDAVQRSEGEIDWPDFLVDLATLEWNIDQVFDGPGVEGEPLLGEEQLLGLGPEQWAEAHLAPVPCLRLLEFHYPVNGYYTAFRKDEKPDIPPARAERVALTRRNYVVRRFEIERPQFQLLRLLVDGRTVGQAIEAAAESMDDDLDTFAARLKNWFRDWAEVGFFRAVIMST